MLKFILGGAVGTTVMTLMMYFVRPIIVGAPMDIAAEIGSKMGDNWWLGMGAHVMLGTIVIPLLLAFVLSKILPGPLIVKGLLTGILLWLLTMLVLMPMLGKGLFLSATGEGPKAIVAAFMAHAVYGLLLGGIAGLPIGRSEQPPTA